MHKRITATETAVLSHQQLDLQVKIASAVQNGLQVSTCDACCVLNLAYNDNS
jgi:hypothetical protein